MIFVQIASYRDPQLIITIEDALKKAEKPENLVFGICWQFDNTEPRDYFDRNPQFRVLKLSWETSKGLGWARQMTNTLYDGEELTLQLDSHHRFVPGWDKIMMEDYNQALEMSAKPILSTYCAPYDPKMPEDTFIKTPSLMSQYEFSQDKLLMSMPWYIGDYLTRTRVIKARTLSGHFFLTQGNFIREVPYDPDIYFGGYTEETTMSLRAFTNGFDFFSPYRTIMWHEYTREARAKHYVDHLKTQEGNKNAAERDAYARAKTRQLFEQEDNGFVMGAYGIGKDRSVRDYELFGGFDFKNCRIQQHTLDVKEPPNPTDYEAQFVTHQFMVKCSWDRSSFNLLNPVRFSLGILTKSDVELLRTPDLEGEEYTTFRKTHYDAVVKSIDKPHKIVMYAWDANGNFSNRYEKDIVPIVIPL